MAKTEMNRGFLNNARAYLSGPMDFVSSRAQERKTGWRVKMGQFLRKMGVTVFDPWSKPRVLGMHEYGKEDVKTIQVRKDWTFEQSEEGRMARLKCGATFRETMHMDLRMVDISDFVIAYCPTNIYSVGTPHEIIVARLQHKPVLFVSPPVTFPTLHELHDHMQDKGDRKGLQLLEQFIREYPIKENPEGIPSLWYMPLIGGDNFFDGFGFAEFREDFGWGDDSPTDLLEAAKPPQRPLLPFLNELNHRQTLPDKYSFSKKMNVPNDDWLLLDLEHEAEEMGNQD